MMRLALALALALAPTALALDLLPSEAELGDTEARILVRAREGTVHVETDPPVLAAASAPAGEPGEFAPTPRALDAAHTWRGLDGVVVVVLRRDAPQERVEVVIEDASPTGISLDWPAVKRSLPLPPIPALALALIAAAKGFAAGRPARP